jgi:hypothetical protein
MKNGVAARTGFIKKFGKDAPNINTVDFKKAVDDGLIPKEESYKEWLNAVKEEVENIT